VRSMVARPPASVDSTSKPTDFSAYLYRLCTKMQAKLTVRELKVFNCYITLHYITLELFRVA